MKKKVKPPSVKDQINILKKQIEFLTCHSMELQSRNAELEKDKVWLKQLAQDLSSTMNAGAKEGSFPRKSN